MICHNFFSPSHCDSLRVIDRHSIRAHMRHWTWSQLWSSTESSAFLYRMKHRQIALQRRIWISFFFSAHAKSVAPRVCQELRPKIFFDHETQKISKPAANSLSVAVQNRYEVDVNLTSEFNLDFVNIFIWLFWDYRTDISSRRYLYEKS